MSGEDNSTFSTFFELFFVFMVLVLIGAYICNGIVNAFPAGYQTYPRFIYNAIFGMFDKSFIFLAIIALFCDPIAAALDPDIFKGILNIFLFFGITYVFIFFNTIAYTLNSAMSANVLLPNTFSFFNNHYTLFLIMGVASLSIILNFKTSKKEVPSAPEAIMYAQQ